MQIRVRTCQNVSKTRFLTLFSDTSAPAADVLQLVSERVRNLACQKMLVRARVSEIKNTVNMTVVRVKTCQKHAF